MPEPGARSPTVFRRGDVGVSQNRGFLNAQILLVSEGFDRKNLKQNLKACMQKTLKSHVIIVRRGGPCRKQERSSPGFGGTSECQGSWNRVR